MDMFKKVNMEVVRSKSDRKLLDRKDTRNSYMVSITRTSEQQTIYTQLPHPIIDISKDLSPSRAAISIGVKLKIVTGTYKDVLSEEHRVVYILVENVQRSHHFHHIVHRLEIYLST
jgi:hypothetical protein